MDHDLTATQDLIRRAARGLFERRYDLAWMREIQQEPPRYARALWEDVCRLGWTALPFPEAIGGVEGSLLDASVLIHEFGRAAAVTPYAHSCVAGGLALAAARPGLAGEVAAGAAVVIPAPSGGPVAVEYVGGKASVSGEIVGVPWMPLATHLLVKGPDGWWLVEADGARVSFEILETSTAEPLAAVRLERAVAGAVPRDGAVSDPALLGAVGQAVFLVGLASRALELAVAYANQRVQFGRVIASFQALQHKAADMYIAIEASRDLAFKAAWAHAERPRSFEPSARHAKAMAGDAAMHVTRQAIQMHGGVAFVDDHPAQLFYLNAIAANSTYGTGPEHRQALAQELLTVGG